MKRLRSKAGFSLGEMMVGVAIGGIVTLAAGSFYVFGENQYQVLQDENSAELDLMRAAFYLRLYMSQAVKTICAPGAIPNPVTLGNVNTDFPQGLPEGLVDCRTGPVVWPQTTYNALAVFVRENGGATPTQFIGGSVVNSSFMGTAIYFVPGSATKGGTLTFANSAPGVATVFSQNSISIGHLVDIQIVGQPGQSQSIPASPLTAASPARLESIAYQVTARHFLLNTANKNYLTTPPNTYTVPFRDISILVNIGLHDNWLGVSMDGTNSTQRLNGAVYYFKFAIPMIPGF